MHDELARITAKVIEEAVKAREMIVKASLKAQAKAIEKLLKLPRK